MAEQSLGIFGNTYSLMIDKDEYEINTKIFDNAHVFDDIISTSNELADNKEVKSRNTFVNILENRKLLFGLLEPEIDSFYKIYKGLKKAKDEGRDSIWKFIIQNLYKPFFLNEKFDLIIGNPPWITYSDIVNSTYQRLLYQLAEKYNLIPDSVANMPHLEIAAIFLSHSASYFLKDKGKIIFVLPRSFISADHHDNTRSGKAKGFRITGIWDLKDVSPLFRVPSTVIFASKYKIKNLESKKIPSSGISGLIVSGKLENHNSNLRDCQDKLDFKNTKWYYSKLNNRSALTNSKHQQSKSINYYKEHFKQGATIVPRNFYFVEPEQIIPDDYKDRIIQFKTSESSLKEAKSPWKEFVFTGRASTNFLFKTALSKNIVPFKLINPPYVLLPIVIKEKNDNSPKNIQIVTAEKILEKGDIETSNWFLKAEKIWKENKTEKSQKMSLYDRVNFQRGITDQDLTMKYLVLYTASAKDANACILNREEMKFDFIVESKAYWFGTNNIKEANYLCCFLNCSYTNLKIKDFQSRGLFGARDVHKKILEIPFPKFDDKINVHAELAKIGDECTKMINTFIGNEKELDLATHHLGKMRLDVRKHLKAEIIKMDKIVKSLVK